ncbi:MAG: hypothetical protein ACLRVD_16680 [Blautia caecimuris]
MERKNKKQPFSVRISERTAFFSGHQYSDSGSRIYDIRHLAGEKWQLFLKRQ